MRIFRLGIVSSALLAPVTLTATGAETPEQVAAGFAAAFHGRALIESELSSVHSRANAWYQGLSTRAEGVAHNSTATLPCDLGGTVTITRETTLWAEVIHGEYASCATRLDNGQSETSGTMSLERWRSSSARQPHLIRVGLPIRFTEKRSGVGFEDVVISAQFEIAGLLRSFDRQGRLQPGPYAHRLNGFISVERFADDGEVASVDTTELGSLVTSGMLAVVPTQQEVQAVSSRFASGGLHVFAFARVPDLTYHEYFWGFENYSTSRLEKGNQVEHTFDGLVRVGIPQMPYPLGCKSGEYRFDTRAPIVENGGWTHDFVKGAIRVNGSSLRFRDTEPHVVIAIPDSGQHYMGNGMAMMLVANCAY